MTRSGLDQVVVAVERLAGAVATVLPAPVAVDRLASDCLRVVYRLLLVELGRQRAASLSAAEAVSSLELDLLPAHLLEPSLLEELLEALAGIDATAEPVLGLGAVHQVVLGRRPTLSDGRLRLSVEGSSGRKAAGSYFTPEPLVEWLLDHTLEPALDDVGADVQVCDPACGAGVFLVAATRRMRRRGVAPDAALARVTGVDTDRAALELARTCLWLELVEPGRPVAMPPLALLADDALLSGVLDHAAVDRGYDVVVGNPPFLNQLERLTAHAPGVAATLNDRSYGTLRPYTDVSAVFLQRAAGWVGPGGRIGLVQPQSLLAARDAAGVRAYVAGTCALEALWASDAPVFDAHVITCAPVLRRGAPQGPVRRFHGPAFDELAPRPDPVLTGGWSYLLAAGLGIPEVVLSRDSGVLADVAACTADFRDQYYGLAPYVHEAADAPTRDVAPLVTSGLIDPAEVKWGTASTRFLKRRWDAPVIDLDALRGDAKLHAWAVRRLVPKVLVGTQGKVVEAVADQDGRWLPSVPTITVVPDPDRLWHVLAVLLAPPVAAHAAAAFAGTALSMRAIKLSAGQVGELPLPSDGEAWDRGADAVRRAQLEPARRREHLVEAGGHMCAAYGDDTALDWWLSRW